MEAPVMELYYEELGQGTPVVFLHGFPFDHEIWQSVVPLVAKEARVILPDLRGHGRSPVPDGVYTMRQMAEDVVQLLDRLEIEKAVLVGHSMGGYVSLAFAHAYPGRLLGLGLVATQSAADNPEKRQSRLKLASSIKRRGMKPVVSDMLPKLTSRQDLLPPLMEVMLRTSPVGAAGALKGMAERPDMTGLLAEIQAPALVLTGLDDQLLPLENVKMMAQMLPKGWLVEVPETGHMLMMEAPEKVAEALCQLVQMVKI